MFDPAVSCGEALPLAGLVLVSARLRADRLAENPNAAGVAAYFGADASLDEARSPMAHAAEAALPVMIVVAEYENPLLDLLRPRVRATPGRGTAPRTEVGAGRAATTTCR